MLLSLVTGTYNRLSYLQNMIQSFRSQLYPAMDYEIILVDGGSTDGTLQWARQQPDVLLIEQGQLLGAIKAFCAGAKAATGDYVLLANDDVFFHPGSILAALVHLEETPTCGGVAFADNRGHEGYYAQHQPCRNGQGKAQFCLYVQVGMVRRELGIMAGWWGEDDAIMQNARTYGGDNFLSSRIWEMGYTIDAIEECRVDDLIARDELRQANYAAGEVDSRLYYTRYANGAQFNASPTIISTPDRMRILYIPVYEIRHPAQHAQKRGLRDALKEIALVAEYDFVERQINGHNSAVETLEIARNLQPHVVLSQILSNEYFNAAWVARMREVVPDVLMVNWYGDQWPGDLMRPETIAMLRAYDLSLMVNAAVLPMYRANGIRAAYWQVASEEPQGRLPKMPSHDVIYLANCYSDYRRKEAQIINRLPGNVAIYGSGWEGATQLVQGQTLYDYARTHALMRNAKICLGDNQYNEAYGFVSNRFFETLYAGGFLLHQHVPGLDELNNVQAGVHYAEFHVWEELPDQVAYWLAHDEEREKIRAAGKAEIRKNHRFRNRVEELFLEIIPRELKEDALALA